MCEVLNSISPEVRSTKKTSALGSSDSFVKTLGMEYNSSLEHFWFSSTELSIEEPLITKREVLSDSAEIDDPLGLIPCVTIAAKIIFQRLWEQGTAWDKHVSPDIQKQWLNWRTPLPEISNIRIPSCYTPVCCPSQLLNCLEPKLGFSSYDVSRNNGSTPEGEKTPLSNSLQLLNPFFDIQPFNKSNIYRFLLLTTYLAFKILLKTYSFNDVNSGKLYILDLLKGSIDSLLESSDVSPSH